MHINTIDAGYRVEAFIEELLPDEDDTSVAQWLVLTKKRFRYRLPAIFDQGDRVTFHADAQTMPPENKKKKLYSASLSESIIQVEIC